MPITLPLVTSYGTSGQVLTSNGAGTAPTFQAASSGGGEVQAICVPGMGTVSGATVAQDDGGELATVRFDDGQNNDEWNCTFVVPKGADGLSITSINLFYKNKAASALNIYGFFKTFKFDNTQGATRTDDTTATTTAFASPSTSGQLGVITAPADAYNAIGTLTEGDLLFVTFNRQGADALDTYGQALYALAMVVTFA